MGKDGCLGWHAIHDAAETGDIRDIQNALQENPALVNARNCFGITPLHLAVAYNDIEVVDYLLSRGAELHARTPTGQTVLHIAAIQGEAPIIRRLIEVVADVHAADRSGATPLHWAARS